jgi:transcriptional regulator with XRE-family HTH domain
MKQNELLARLQTAGIDMSTPALSLLEGQKRPVSDIELKALAEILNVPVDWLLGTGKRESPHK